MKSLHALVGVCIGEIASLACWAQSDLYSQAPDSAIYLATQVHRDALGSNSKLFYGTEHREVIIRPQDVGHPYFHSQDFTSGSIRYEGQYFPRAYLLYDLVHDKLVVENPQGFSVELIQDRVEGFTIGSHSFKNILDSDSAYHTLRSGFYEVLFDGKVKAYAKKSKEVLTKIENGVEIKKYRDRTRYFIYKDGVLYPVSSRKSIMEVFADEKASMKSEARQLNFRIDRDHAIRSLTQLYDKRKAG